VQWGLPSPYFGEQRKDNPKAKNARFKTDGVVVSNRSPEVYLSEERIAEILIERGGSNVG